MTKLIWFPVVASAVLIGYADHLAISQRPKNYMQMSLKSSEKVAELDEATAIKLSQTTKKIDAKAAFDLVWQLPLVQRKAREIKQLSQGTIQVSAIVYDYPTPDDPYYKVRVFDGEPEHDTTIYWFRVLNTGDVIEVLDVIDNKYISLREWREQLKR
ncbi:hypothetical protein [Nodularia sp. NIES-3585]|uniref:hypothetical protein n=1 Tax=Nodularia sp. NIES-3585 TaxID=1973477 RepID=UPI000B5C4058|nr:hypothetical protein [Nodularia sp. NIES-3585]GAX35961.1 hypothetical protein NIES3585_19810 [Nodularia sp. NIES-3585]